MKKKILFAVLTLMMCITAQAQKLSLDNRTRIQYSYDSLIVRSALEGDPVIGYCVKGTYICINFRWHATNRYYYIIRRRISPTMRVGFRGNNNICLRIGPKTAEYYFGIAERKLFLNWLDK